jgi:transposase-like protein
MQPDLKDLSQDLRASYAVATLEEAASALDRFEASWGDKYPAIGPSWRAAWDRAVRLSAGDPQSYLYHQCD